jgi:hypothetical protein
MHETSKVEVISEPDTFHFEAILLLLQNPLLTDNRD